MTKQENVILLSVLLSTFLRCKISTIPIDEERRSTQRNPSQYSAGSLLEL